MRMNENNVWISDDALRSWVAARYGDDEAEKAKQLPRELFTQMYGEILKYGPAAEEIQNCIEAARKTDLSTIYPNLRRVSEMWHDGSCLNGLDTDFQGWFLSRGYSSINRLVTNASAEFAVLGEGWRMVFWLLNGQYLFPSGMVSANSDYAQSANRILAWLGLPILRGALGSKHHE